MFLSRTHSTAPSTSSSVPCTVCPHHLFTSEAAKGLVQNFCISWISKSYHPGTLWNPETGGLLAQPRCTQMPARFAAPWKVSLWYGTHPAIPPMALSRLLPA